MDSFLAEWNMAQRQFSGMDDAALDEAVSNIVQHNVNLGPLSVQARLRSAGATIQVAYLSQSLHVYLIFFIVQF
jgi:hypothetical protein